MKKTQENSKSDQKSKIKVQQCHKRRFPMLIYVYKHAFLANTYNHITCIVSLTHLHNMLIRHS